MTVKAQEHFAIVPEALLFSDVSAGAIRLYAVLDRFSNKDTRTGHPSRKTLAERMRCSVDTVDRLIRELASAGFLRKQPRYQKSADENGHRQTSNDFELLRIPSRTDAAPESRTDAAPPGLTDAAPGTKAFQNESQLNERTTGLAPQARAPDAIYETLFALETGQRYSRENRKAVTKTAASLLATKSAEIRDTGIDSDELRAAIASWPSLFGDATCTAAGVAKHLPRLRSAARGLIAKRSPESIADAVARIAQRRQQNAARTG